MDPTEEQIAQHKRKKKLRVHFSTILTLLFVAGILLAGLFKIVHQETDHQGVVGFVAFSIFLLILIGYCCEQRFSNRHHR